jgi:hypothetical protein
MKPLETIYWLRLGFGLLAALICTGYGYAFGMIPRNPDLTSFPTDTSLLFNTLSIAIIIYLVSYYAVKSRFLTRVKKSSKLFTTGIGIYFISWIVFWTMLYTIIAGAPAPPPAA